MKSAVVATAKEKASARYRVQKAIRDGSIGRRFACEACGSGVAVVPHHEDYERPLDVVWLCGTCHSHRHHAIREEAGSNQRKRQSEAIKAYWASPAGQEQRAFIRRLAAKRRVEAA